MLRHPFERKRAMADDGMHALVNQLDGWEGFEVAAVRREETPSPDVLGDPAPRLIIELRAKPDTPRRCSRCGEIVIAVHEVTPRRVRDLPLAECDTWLIVPQARLQCPRCGPTVEAIPWMDR